MVQVGNKNTKASTTSSTSHSMTMTIGIDTSRKVVVQAALVDSSSPLSTIDSITFNGTNMTRVVQESNGTSSIIIRTELWEILEADLPGTGTYDIDITISPANPMFIGAIELIDAGQALSTNTAINNNSAASSISQSITTVYDNSLILSSAAVLSNTSFTSHGTDQNEQWDVAFTATNSITSTLTTELKATAGSDTQSHTAGGSGRIVLAAAEFFGQLPPSISAVDGGNPYFIRTGESGVTITGIRFSATNNVVEIGDNSNYGTANLDVQTITSESTTSIDITTVRSNVGEGQAWLFVTHEDGYISDGFPIWFFDGLNRNVYARTGTITAPASTGNQAYSGLTDFTGKALFLWGVSVTSDTAVVHKNIFFGFTDGTNEQSIATTSEDGVSTADTSRIANNTRVLTVATVNGAVSDTDLLATFVSFSSTGFTLNFSKTISGTIIHYCIFGGEHLDAEVINVAGDSSPVSGLSSKPEIVFTMSTLASTNPSAFSSDLFSVGCFDGYNGNEWWLYNSGASPHSALVTTGFMGEGTSYELSFSALTDDGWSWTGTNTDLFAALVLNMKGGGGFVSNFTKETTGSDSVSQSLPDFGFKPGLVMMASAEKTSQDLATPTDCLITFGAYDGYTGNQTSITTTIEKLTNFEAGMRSNSSKVLGIADLYDTYDAVADMNEITTNTPSVTWSPNNTTAYIIGVWGINTFSEETPVEEATLFLSFNF